MTGYSLQARDGEIGQLKHIYFDDRHWTVRYFVAHTGSWLLGQDVLIVPSVITGIDEKNRHIAVDLDREQVRNCPPIDTELPVSRHYEQAYYRYYGWPPYWSGDPLLGAAAYVPQPIIKEPPQEPEPPYLRSSDEVTGYYIHARDGDIGHVEDFILEDPAWTIRYLEVETRNWLPGKNVLIAPTWIQHVDWARKEVRVDLSRDAIRTAPAYDSSGLISRDYQVSLYKHYGMTFQQE